MRGPLEVLVRAVEVVLEVDLDGEELLDVEREHPHAVLLDHQLEAALEIVAVGALGEALDEADKASCRPDFTVLIYPAYLSVKEQGDKIAPELPITANTPQTFLVMTEDDGVRVEGPLYYYLALKRAKVSAELHLYPTGGHGYGLRPSPQTVTTWPARAADWLQARKLLEK